MLGRLNLAELATVASAEFCPFCGALVAAGRRGGYQHCAPCDSSFSLERPV